MRELIKVGADVHAVIKNGWSVLMVAAVQGHARTVAVLLEHGADPNFQVASSSGDDSGLTPLMLTAASRQDNDCTSLLLQNKADVNTKCDGGLDALMIAARHGLTDTVEMLLQTGADYKRARPGGATALMDAASCGQEAVLNMLIAWAKEHPKGPIDLDAVDEDGCTALMHASRNSYENAMLPLLQGGAHVTLKDNDGRTALAQAASYQAATRLLSS